MCNTIVLLQNIVPWLIIYKNSRIEMEKKMRSRKKLGILFFFGGCGEIKPRKREHSIILSSIYPFYNSPFLDKNIRKVYPLLLMYNYIFYNNNYSEGYGLSLCWITIDFNDVNRIFYYSISHHHRHHHRHHCGLLCSSIPSLIDLYDKKRLTMRVIIL